MQDVNLLSEALHVLNKEAKRLRDKAEAVWDYAHNDEEAYSSIHSPAPESSLECSPIRAFKHWAAKQTLKDFVDPSLPTAIQKEVLSNLQHEIEFSILNSTDDFDELFSSWDDRDYIEEGLSIENEAEDSCFYDEVVDGLMDALSSFAFKAQTNEEERQWAWDKYHDKLEKDIEDIYSLKDAGLEKLKKHFVCYHTFSGVDTVFEYYEIGSYSFHRPTELYEDEVEGEVKHLDASRIPYYEPNSALSAAEAKRVIEGFLSA